MSHRSDGSGGYYPQSNATFTGQNHRFNAMRMGANKGDQRQALNHSRNTQLFMGDLDPSWDETAIREIWKSLGEGNIDIKMMWNNRNGSRTNMGFCFIQFPSQEHASNALLKNGAQIPGHPSKTLRLNWSSSSYSNSQESGEISVFVGDLAPNVTEADLFEVFIARYASTSHVKVVYDPVTGVSKGYAFVKFGNREDQQRALQEMAGTFVKGRAIRIGSAGHQTQRNRGGLMTDNKSRKLTGTLSNTKSSKVNAISASQFMFPTQQIPPLNCFTDPNNTTILLKDLSPSVSEKELRASLQPFGQVVYAKMLPDKRCGVAQYVDRVAAEAALRKLQGFRIRGSKITVSWSKPVRQMNELPSQYQAHPSLKEPTYGYIPPSSDRMLSSLPGKDLHPNQNINDGEIALLPGCSTFQYTQFPARASGVQNVFEQDPGETATPEPRIFQDTDVFIQSALCSMDRIEDGSNGHLFA
ncbi:hypothetical protein HG536_0E02570 [Torulaspora globosa]|uniref:RRM domain-containing protein n=1 Tax=Torulaspora globosa TaxID=48254 RepID=A0A7G3ZIL0_9SACH|nr:uncharacterized protein HG536_0E02570 [Torulaspora globosa]QLL33346.1 hypothetical protein HG536_0E02570 [Torulaspora globosa]